MVTPSHEAGARTEDPARVRRHALFWWAGEADPYAPLLAPVVGGLPGLVPGT